MSQRRPPLTVEQIRAWAESHRRRTGYLPRSISGPVAEAPGESWDNINRALRHGRRGLPGGSSLADLLAEHPESSPRRWRRPPLKVDLILLWADDYRESHGKLPTSYSGPVRLDRNENWRKIDNALRFGLRGLPGGDSLACLLERERGHRHIHRLPPLTEDAIAGWARAWHEARGTWPNEDSGPIPGARGEVWANVNAALARGTRGLPGDDSLAALLARSLGVRTRAAVPPLSVPEILGWADLHQEDRGVWPTSYSGAILGVEGETWDRIDEALRQGTRSLPGGSSLARLLHEHRGVPGKRFIPRLRVKEIRAWARAYQKRTGKRPTRHSGEIPEAPGETWAKVESALWFGNRGLPGGSSLAELLGGGRRRRKG